MVGLIVNASGNLTLGGQRFRNIGMNYVGGVQRLHYQPSPTAIEYTPSLERAGDMVALADMGVKVIRVNAFPYWPSQWTVGVLAGKAWNVATLSDRQSHYAQIDDVIAKAKAAGIGVILNLFFRFASVSDLAGETPRGWLSNGNTRAFAGTLIDELTARYASESGVYGWEFSNELNHRNDQTDPLGAWPGKSTSYGTRSDYSAANTIFNGDELSTVLAWFYARVRQTDAQRLVMTGNGPNSFFGTGAISFPLSKWIAEMRRDNPMDNWSMHFYGGLPYCSTDFRGLSSLLTGARYWAQQEGKAFVVGEFGNQPATDVTLTAASSTITIARTISLNMVPGEMIEVRGASQPEYNGIFTVASVDSDQRSATYVAASAPSVSPATGGIAVQFRDRLARMLDDVIYSNCDLAMIWEYTRDPAAPILHGPSDPYTTWQIPLITAANATLAA